MATKKYEEIRIANRIIRPHKCIKEPNFKARAVHISSGLQYVAMLLKHENKEASLFWTQAIGFYEATKKVDVISKPLTAYYCALNLIKALLVYNKVQFAKRIQHGLTGRREGTKASLSNEKVVFQGGGVSTELRRFLGEPVAKQECDLLEILYNLPYIHRAYCVAFSSREKNELFIPLYNPRFIKIRTNKEVYFAATLSQGWSNKHTVKKLPEGFEQYPLSYNPDGTIDIRWKERFKWEGKSETKNLDALSKHHEKLRKKLFYIHDSPGVWYLKRDVSDALPYSPITLTFAALHRLSELARYEPQSLEKHLDNRYNWLLVEFLERCLDQIIDELVAEITKKELRPSGA